MFSSGYALGLLFIALVAVIWAAASVLVQYLYEDYSFHSPFLVTYIGVSLFSLWIPTQWFTAWLRNKATSSVNESSATHAYANVPTSTDGVAPEEHSSVPDDRAGEHASSEGISSPSPHNLPWTKEQHFWVACKIAPVWFLANWTYNGSLALTSITSSTVLASTGSLFTFLFAILARDENFHWMKLTGVLLGFGGSVLTTLDDSSTEQQQEQVGSHVVLGDLLGLISACGYGAYAVQTRLYCPHDESLYSMQLLLGYIGVINMVALSPIAIYELWFSHNTVGLTATVFGFLVVKGLLDNVVSDYLWLRAVVLINATVATVGLGLTIPLAFASDVLLGKSDVFTPGSIVGALTVLAGFVLVNVGNDQEFDASKETNQNDSMPLQRIKEGERIREDARIPDDSGEPDHGGLVPSPPPMQIV